MLPNYFFSQQRAKPQEAVDRAGGRGLHHVNLDLGGPREADPLGRGRGEPAAAAEPAGAQRPPLAKVPHRRHRPHRACIGQLAQQVGKWINLGCNCDGPEPAPEPECELEMMSRLSC